MTLKAAIATWARRVCDPRDTKAAWAVARLLLIAEAVLCSAIIAKVPCVSRHCRSPSPHSHLPWFFSRFCAPRLSCSAVAPFLWWSEGQARAPFYTKIDRDAYMAQVTGFQHGERDYTKLERGRHGPPRLPYQFYLGEIPVLRFHPFIHPSRLLHPTLLHHPPDTKIDWDAYMAQVTGFQHGERDYTKLEGDTGPLVYPAGFLLSFSALKWITGGIVANAQAAFLVLYLINLLMVFAIYIRTQAVPPWVLVLLCLSKRLHSIFLLRLFNDCLAMAFLHASLLRLQSSRWIPAVLLFSAGVSVKMNVLLFLPPLLLIMAKTLPLLQIMALLGAAVAFQLLVGWPFISTFPQAYFGRAFDLGRVFIHFWSVNFKFVPESTFVSKPFALSLLGLHLLLLLLFCHFCWCKYEGGMFRVAIAALLSPFKRLQTRPLHPDHITYLMLVGNFIGIFCARSLHYQFYSWYYFSIPYLLWISPLPTPLRLLLWLTIELCWNIYPSTPASSLSLLLTHLSLLLALWMAPPRLPFGADEQSWQGQGGAGKGEGGAVGEMEGMGKEEREAMWQQYVQQMTREAEAQAAAAAAAGAGEGSKGAEGEKRKAE
ncbi:unnamed protein product [Closterium sp. NIES-64]|nr:unnamed protein product [Closterium sp. NIES-64]